MANALKLVTYSGNTSYSTADTDVTVYTVPADTTTIVIGMTVCNNTDSIINIGAKITDNSSAQTINLLKTIPIAAGAALEVMTGNKMILNVNDDLILNCDVNYGFDAAISLVEQT